MAETFQIYLTSYRTGCLMRVEGDAVTGEMRIAQEIRLGGQTLAMACAPDGRHLHVATLAGAEKTSDPLYATLSVDPLTGALTHCATVPAPAYMVHLSMDRSGRWLFGASEPTGRISVTRIKPDGLPEAEPAQVIEGLDRPHHILTDRTNRHCYVPCMGSDHVRRFDFDAASGRLGPAWQPMVQVAAGRGPRHMAHHPALDRAWLVTQHDGAVVTCAIDPGSGALTELASDSMMPDSFQGSPRGAQIHVSPDGGRLFVTERASGSVVSWRIDGATGLLSDRQIAACPTGLRCFHIDPSGRFLVASGVNSDRALASGDTPGIACFAIDPNTGRLGAPRVLDCMDGIYWVEIAGAAA
ncbi:MAG: lactonase family protein [Pseudorhodobacter sp.]